MTKEDRNRADARFNKATRAAKSPERQVRTRRRTEGRHDNMAKLKALRLAREAAEPPRPPGAKEDARQVRRSRRKKARHWGIGWRTSRAAVAAPEFVIQRNGNGAATAFRGSTNQDSVRPRPEEHRASAVRFEGCHW